MFQGGDGRVLTLGHLQDQAGDRQGMLLNPLEMGWEEAGFLSRPAQTVTWGEAGHWEDMGGPGVSDTSS